MIVFAVIMDYLEYLQSEKTRKRTILSHYFGLNDKINNPLHRARRGEIDQDILKNGLVRAQADLKTLNLLVVSRKIEAIHYNGRR